MEFRVFVCMWCICGGVDTTEACAGGTIKTAKPRVPDSLRSPTSLIGHPTLPFATAFYAPASAPIACLAPPPPPKNVRRWSIFNSRLTSCDRLAHRRTTGSESVFVVDSQWLTAGKLPKTNQCARRMVVEFFIFDFHSLKFKLKFKLNSKYSMRTAVAHVYTHDTLSTPWEHVEATSTDATCRSQHRLFPRGAPHHQTRVAESHLMIDTSSPLVTACPTLTYSHSFPRGPSGEVQCTPVFVAASVNHFCQHIPGLVHCTDCACWW